METRRNAVDPLMNHEGVITLLATECGRLLEHDAEPELLDWAESEAARLGVWAAMLGVFAAGDMSVDHRLRKNIDVSQLLIELLNILVSDLRQLKLMPLVHARSIDQPPAKRARKDEPERFTGRSASGSPSSDEDETVATLQNSISADIGRLLRYAAQIRQYSDQREDDRSIAYDPKGSDGESLIVNFSEHLRFMVDRMLPTAAADSAGVPHWLRDRLIEVAEQRWKKLMYGRRRAIARGVGAAHLPTALPMRSVGGLKPTQESSPGVARGASSTKDPQMVGGPETGHLQSINGATTLAGSVRLQNTRPAALSQAGSSATQLTGGKLSFPPPPSTPKGVDVFECPYCWRPKDVKEAQNARKWRTHVMHDLRPYFCIFEDCKTPCKTYPTASKWIEHLDSEHASTTWICQVCKHESICESDAIVHTRQSHDPSMEESAAVLIARKSINTLPLQLICCTFCQFGPVGEDEDELQSSICSHIGQDHMKGVALMSIPWDFGDDGSVLGGSVATEQDKGSVGAMSSYDLNSNDESSRPKTVASQSSAPLTMKSLSALAENSTLITPPTTLVLGWARDIPLSDDSPTLLLDTNASSSLVDHSGTVVKMPYEQALDDLRIRGLWAIAKVVPLAVRWRRRAGNHQRGHKGNGSPAIRVDHDRLFPKRRRYPLDESTLERTWLESPYLPSIESYAQQHDDESLWHSTGSAKDALVMPDRPSALSSAGDVTGRGDVDMQDVVGPEHVPEHRRVQGLGSAGAHTGSLDLDVMDSSHQSASKKASAPMSRFACDMCGKTFGRVHQLTKHIKAVHMPGNHQCRYCGARFHWPKDLRRHEDAKHQADIHRAYESDNSKDSRPGLTNSSGRSQGLALERLPDRNSGGVSDWLYPKADWAERVLGQSSFQSSSAQAAPAPAPALRSPLSFAAAAKTMILIFRVRDAFRSRTKQRFVSHIPQYLESLEDNTAIGQ